MTPTLAWLLVAFVTQSNGNATSTFVPGVANEQACHALAGQLNLMNHMCVSYPAAGAAGNASAQPAHEATNSITQWALTVRSVYPGEAPTVLQGIVSEHACEQAAAEFGEPQGSRWHLCTPYEAPRPTKIVRKIVQPQSRGLFW